MGAEEGPTCITMRRSKTRMKEARKARETSSLGRKPRFRWSQLIQSVLMTKTTTDVREMSTVLHRDEEREDARGQERTGRVGIRGKIRRNERKGKGGINK